MHTSSNPSCNSLSRRAAIRGAAMLSAGIACGIRPAFAASSAGAEGNWPEVTAVLDRYVARRELPGAVAALGWGDGPLSTVVRGTEGFTDADEMAANSLFRVYSMTKPITGMAAMLLIDEGKLQLDGRLSDYAPEFKDMRVAIDPARSLESRPAGTPISIRHLLTHTAGFGYALLSQNKVGDELVRQGLTPSLFSRLAVPGLLSPVPAPPPDEFLRRAASIPLVAEPGTTWHYSMSLDVLGLVIQRVAGAKSFGDFLQERIFKPAGMSSSFFRLPKADVSRMTTNYVMIAGVPVPVDRPADSIYLDPVPFAFGGAGLVSTPADYDRFLQMLLGKGKVGGIRVMSERAVALGMSNLLPPGIDTRGTLAGGGGFGAGGRVGLGEDAGTFGWTGAAGTIGFVNTRIGLRAGLYIQAMPPEALPIRGEFMQAVREDAVGRVRL